MSESNPVHDPNGPPVLSYYRPNMGKRVALIAGGSTLATGAAATVLLIVAAVAVTPTSGAMRSTHVRWEERQTEIAAAQSDAASEQGSQPAEQGK